MSMFNSWCSRIFVLSLTVVISLTLLDFKFNILPVNGVWLLLYTIIVIFFTIWITFTDIQKLLQCNVPLEYNFESNRLIKNYKNVCKLMQLYLQTIENCFIRKSPILSEIKDSDNREENKKIHPNESIDKRIELLVDDISEKFISKWYCNISEDESFCLESKILLEGIVRRVLQVSIQIDKSKLAYGFLVILMKHLKEYRRAVKRVGKNGGNIESVYRYSHVGSKSNQTLQHFVHRLTANVLREFISWELWNSLPCRLLVSILAKRLTMYIICYVSQPAWLNYKILQQCLPENEFEALKLNDCMYISLSGVNIIVQHKIESKTESTECKDNDSVTPKMSPKKDGGINLMSQVELDSNSPDTLKLDIISFDSGSVVEQALTKLIAQQTAPILQRAEKTFSDKTVLEPPCKTPVANEHMNYQDKFKLKRSEPVKIHSAKSSKRWDESDCGHVSIGQDILAIDALDGSSLEGFSGTRLWGHCTVSDDLKDTDKTSLWELNDTWFKEKEIEVLEDTRTSPKKLKHKDGNKPNSPTNIPHCLRPATTSAVSFVTNTIKPIAGNVTATTLHNMKEFQQSTVNNVVKPVSNATEKAIHKIGDLQDEAVGVVEGIFDFGMAGIRKGLRLTGLQDNSTDMVHKVKSPLVPDVKQTKNNPKLIKTGHVCSEENKTCKTIIESNESVWINPLAKESPNGFENQMLLEKSPCAVEVGNNLNTSEPTINIAGICIDSDQFPNDSPEYEETADLASTISKLRSLLQQKSSESSLNTPAHSPMYIDDKSCITPIEPAIPDGTKVDGGMQRFARTVTGMFNTFKTALPGNVTEQQTRNDQWIFIENEISNSDLPSLLNSLLVERRDYCTIDTAYEAMDSLDLMTDSINSQTGKIQWENQIYEDELDGFDSSIPITKALLDVLCECLQETTSALTQEPVMKALLIMAGSKMEKALNGLANKLLRYINRSVGTLPTNKNDSPAAMKLEEIVEKMEKSLPYYIKEIFGHEDLKAAISFFIFSLQYNKINQDVILQLFELCSSQLIYASSQMSPTPSA